MKNENNVQRYMEQDKICKEQIAIIEPFLKKFSEEHDAGTRFYSDITVLCGPMPFFGTGWFYNTDEGKEVNKRFRQNKASIYVIKWAGAAFVIDYEMTGKYVNHIHVGDYISAIKNTFMVYEGKKYPVPLNIAVAVKKLYDAQEYRSAIYGAHRNEINRARIGEMKQQIVR